MKILAIEKESGPVDWTLRKELLEKEARAVYKLQLTGDIREIYFNENRNAILILEHESLHKARQMIESLPLVKEGLIDFLIMELRPYDGFMRLFKDDS